MKKRLRQRVRSGLLVLALLLLCWMAPFMILGRRLGRAAQVPSLHLTPATEACAECRSCELNCPMSLDVPDLVASGSMYHAECILCGSCVDACAKSAIAYSFGRDRRPPRDAASGASFQ
jgi:ferredoxin-type protein NapH